MPTPVSDLASLGYVFVEMLSGEYPFSEARSPDDLIAAKRRLPEDLVRLLPHDVAENKRLLRLVRRLIDPDPAQRFASAEAADLGSDGAAEFQKQLVKGNLSSEYANDIRLLLEELG